MEGYPDKESDEGHGYRSDDMPRLGGSRPTKELDPDLEAQWPPGTCYFCRKNVSKGKDGYSIVPALQAKVYAHRVCSTKVRKDRLALVIAEQRAARLAAKEELPVDEPPPPAAAQHTPSPHSPALVPSVQHGDQLKGIAKPFKKRLLADAWLPNQQPPASDQHHGLPQAEPEAHSQSTTTSQSLNAGDDPSLQSAGELGSAGKRARPESDVPDARISPDPRDADPVKRRRHTPEPRVLPEGEPSSAAGDGRKAQPEDTDGCVEAAVASLQSLGAQRAGAAETPLKSRPGQEQDLEEEEEEGSQQTGGLTLEAEVAASLQELSSMASLALEQQQGEVEPIVRRTRGSLAEAEVIACLQILGSSGELNVEDTPDSASEGMQEAEPIVRRTRINARINTVAEELAASLQELKRSASFQAEERSSAAPRTSVSIEEEGTQRPSTSSPGHSGDSHVASTHRVRSKRRPDKTKWGSIADLLKADADMLAGKEEGSDPADDISAVAQKVPPGSGPRPKPAPEGPAKPTKKPSSVAVPSLRSELKSAGSQGATGSDAKPGSVVEPGPKKPLPANRTTLQPATGPSGKNPPVERSRAAKAELPVLSVAKAKAKAAAPTAADAKPEPQTPTAQAARKRPHGPAAMIAAKKAALEHKRASSSKVTGGSDPAKNKPKVALLASPQVDPFSDLLKLSPRLVAAREAATIANTRMLSSTRSLMMKSPAPAAPAPKADPQPKNEEGLPTTSSLSSVPDWNLNINQCRARLKSFRERTERAEKDAKEQSGLLQAAEKRVKALQQQVDRLSKASTSGRASGPQAKGKNSDLAGLALEAQENLEKAGFPRLLRKFLRGTSEGNIIPSPNSLWWHLVNDASTNLLRPSSNKFQFSPQTKEWLFNVFHAPTGRVAYGLLRGEGGMGSNTWDVDGAQYNIPLPSTRTLHQFAKEHPDIAAAVMAATALPQ